MSQCFFLNKTIFSCFFKKRKYIFFLKYVEYNKNFPIALLLKTPQKPYKTNHQDDSLKKLKKRLYMHAIYIAQCTYAYAKV